MRSFLFQIMVYSCLFWLSNLGIGYYLSTYETVDLYQEGHFFPALRWEEYYQRDEPINLLILGSSHAYRAYDPMIIGENLNKKNQVFNFGSSAQSPLNGYFVLQEVLQKHRPKLIVLDLYFMAFTIDDQLRNRRFNYQFMQNGVAKQQFFREGFSLEEKVALKGFPSYVYKDYLKNKFNKLLGRPFMLKTKGGYQGAGFVSNQDTLSIEELSYQNQFDVFSIELDAITKRNLLYLEKIKKYCANEKIPLVFTSSPMPEISVEKIGNYQAFHELFANLAKKWSVPFFDYNIDRIEELSDTAHYYDDDHLNAAGARIFSKALTEDLENLLLKN